MLTREWTEGICHRGEACPAIRTEARRDRMRIN